MGILLDIVHCIILYILSFIPKICNGKHNKNLDFVIAENENQTWVGSDRDYTYDELLKRVFEIMHDKNPEMVAGKKQKFVMRPPQVVRIGTKKTSFANFTEICKTYVV